MTNERLAQLIGLSPSACLARVKRLEADGTIRRYRAEIDESLFARWSLFQAEITLTQAGRASRRGLEEAVVACPYILEAHESLGVLDLVLLVALQSVGDWREIEESLDPDAALIDRVNLRPIVRTVKHESHHPLLGPDGGLNPVFQG